MPNFELWEITDSQLAEAITYARDKWIASTTPEEGHEWREAMNTFISEQRHRMDLMLKDETDAVKLDSERKLKEAELSNEKGKQKAQNWLKGLEVLVSGLGVVSTVYSAWAGLKGKTIESVVKAQAWERICKLEENGDIPLNQANKFIKP